jgi:type IV pilus assembly protein PilC
MPGFAYVAKDQSGKTIRGTLDTLSKASAIDYLRQRNLIIVSIEQEQQRRRLLALPAFLTQRVKLDDIVVFARQLATMVDAGIPLVNSFDILGDQAEKPILRKVFLGVRDDIQTGSSLSGSLIKYTSFFSPLFVNMVKAGESSGMLDEILERLATYLEKTNALLRKIRAALVYPAIISVMAVVITGILLLRVVPVFEEIFAGFGAELPIPTQILISVSNFLRTYFFLWMGALIVASFFAYRYIKTDKGKTQFDRMILRLPVFGELTKKVAISKFSRTFSTLTRSGVPILTSLEIVGRTAGNKVIEIAVDEVRKNIREGEKIAEPLAHSDVFPPMVVRMIAVGEETGELEKMLSKIADFYDEQVEAAAIFKISTIIQV